MFQHHYLYCIENLVNGKLYVGKHSAKSFDNSYMGSGVAIRAAIKKHGLENFRKYILRTFESGEEALAAEHFIVDKDFVKDENTYNLIVGGQGGESSFINSDIKARIAKNRRAAVAMHIAIKNSPESQALRSKHLSDVMKRRHAAGKAFRPDWSGRSHREEVKRAMSEAAASRVGEKNSMFGKTFIHHPIDRISKAVSKEELQSWLNQGWKKGRLLSEDAIVAIKLATRRGEDNPAFGKVWIHHPIDEISKAVPSEQLESWIANGWLKGRFLTEKSKQVLRDSAKRRSGENHSCFGKIWICHPTDESSPKQVSEEESQTFFDQGWVKGMKMMSDNKKSKHRFLRA